MKFEFEALAAYWWVFREHHPVGAYLPVGQLDGDCKCGRGAWPCELVEATLAAASAEEPAEDAQIVASLTTLLSEYGRLAYDLRDAIRHQGGDHAALKELVWSAGFAPEPGGSDVRE